MHVLREKIYMLIISIFFKIKYVIMYSHWFFSLIIAALLVEQCRISVQAQEARARGLKIMLSIYKKIMKFNYCDNIYKISEDILEQIKFELRLGLSTAKAGFAANNIYNVFQSNSFSR